VVLALIASVTNAAIARPGDAAAAGVAASSSSVGLPSARTAVTLKRPAATAAGDLMLAAVASHGATGSFSAPDGWTLVREDGLGHGVRQAIYHRVAGAAEPASYTWASLGEERRMAGGITSYTGVDATHPINAHGALLYPDENMTVTAPSVTASVTGTLLVHFAAVGSEGTMTPPPDMMERWEAGSPDRAPRRGVLVSSADTRLETAGPAGTRTARASRPGPAIGAAVTLRPAAGFRSAAMPAAGMTAAATTEADIAVVGSAFSETPESRASVTVDRPAGTQPGHVMVATVSATREGGGILAPEGWIRVRDDTVGRNVGQAIFTRVAGTEPGSYTFPLAGGKHQVAAGITTYSGVDPANPVEAHGALTHTGTPSRRRRWSSPRPAPACCM
jgi:hypothetical protein